MAEFARPRVIGFNHVALEVGDIEEALAFYGRLFRFELRGKSDSMAFIDLSPSTLASWMSEHRELTSYSLPRPLPQPRTKLPARHCI
jgi:catechol 2,3-dioxygenase-like lactoylglutathione lyase family enzyme